ncbi:TetR/AcrR family transcriptional regulator [Deinococcus yavapaiensis]|uniref:TetR family transcriptional regulator n=1 Tax=Deinococcus yavapaiensis KR-236 TaxID=694435 RepID=A0A318SCR1_9DEIO|nr:TetR/AcrR family transcriptional regulator [Deinococcus yavapaiensis]PYE56423.1 TetR family transcriptional regulator [Deinococcus yavapaiensis KR-236]
MAETVHDQIAALKRAHILAAAGKVFAEKGFHATTIKDVARAASVADGTIYNYFDNKAALLLGIFDEAARTVRGTINPAELAAASPRDVLRALLRFPLHAFDESNSALFRTVLSAVLTDRDLARRFGETILAPLRDEGGLPKSVAGEHDPALVARLVASVVIGLLVQRALSDESLEAVWNDLPDRLTDLLLRGLDQRAP